MEVYSKYNSALLLICIPVIAMWYYITSEFVEPAMLPMVLYGLLTGYCVGRYFEDKKRTMNIISNGTAIPGRIKRIARVYYGKIQKSYVLEVEADSKTYFSDPVSPFCLKHIAEDVQVYLLKDEYFVSAKKSKEVVNNRRHVSRLRIDRYPTATGLLYRVSFLSIVLAGIIYLAGKLLQLH